MIQKALISYLMIEISRGNENIVTNRLQHVRAEQFKYFSAPNDFGILCERSECFLLGNSRVSFLVHAYFIVIRCYFPLAKGCYYKFA